MIPLEDDNDEKMKIGEKIKLVLFHKHCQKRWWQWGKGKMSKSLMIFGIWRPQRPQVYQDKGVTMLTLGDVEEDDDEMKMQQ